MKPKFPSQGHDHKRCIQAALARAGRHCLDHRVRLTPIRRKVLELVWSSHRPALAYEILDWLSEPGRRIAPPTVYRALDFLMAQGLIHRVESLNAFVGCPKPSKAHSAQFLVCESCRNAVELDDPEIETLISRRADKLGFTSRNLVIEVAGLCPECRR